jgi:hypothetical protein
MYFSIRLSFVKANKVQKERPDYRGGEDIFLDLAR